MKEYIEKVGEAAARALAYAVQRNLPQFLDDLQLEARETGKPVEKRITIRLDITAPTPEYASLKVASISWPRLPNFRDNNFPEEEVDLKQPCLPGILDGQTAPAKQERPIHFGPECLDTLEVHNLINAAYAADADILMPCDWKDQPRAADGLIRYSVRDKEWSFHLIPQGQMQTVLDTAVDRGLIVYRRVETPEGDAWEMDNASADRIREALNDAGAVDEILQRGTPEYSEWIANGGVPEVIFGK